MDNLEFGYLYSIYPPVLLNKLIIDKRILQLIWLKIIIYWTVENLEFVS
jgi:hypothetical protein